jgi:hypothetical protein
MEVIAINVLPYFTTAIGFMIVFVLNGIKSEIKEVKTSVKALEEDFRDTIKAHDHRLTKIETGCNYMHGRHGDQ